MSTAQRKERFQIGLLTEESVCSHLEDSGWRIVDHRARTRWGELDLVARRGDMMIFGEVKSAGRTRVAPTEVIDGRAQHRLRQAAVAWMATHQAAQVGIRRYRFDVFFVFRDKDQNIERIEHIENAF